MSTGEECEENGHYSDIYDSSSGNLKRHPRRELDGGPQNFRPKHI